VAKFLDVQREERVFGFGGGMGVLLGLGGGGEF